LLSKLKLYPTLLGTRYSWLLIPVRASGDPFVASSFVGSEPSHGVALDPVSSINVAYCYVLMTPSPGACDRTGVNVPIDSDSFVCSWLVIFILEPPSLRAL
jgi:hypothetical protein